MDIKTLQSKINLLNAQIKQFNESELFSAEEKVSLTRPALIQLQQLEPKLADLKAAQHAEDMDVQEPEILK